MKFRVGDRVIHSIFGKGTIIGIDNYCDDFFKYCVEFDKKNKYLHDGNNFLNIRGKSHHCYWCNENNLKKEDGNMKFKVEESETMSKPQTPAKPIIYNNKKYDVVSMENDYYSPFIGQVDYRLCLKEHKEEILDKEEKEYLSALIRPFKDRIEYIEKNDCGDDYCIHIHLKNDGIYLPDFKKCSMYKGMKAKKEYSLEELGL